MLTLTAFSVITRLLGFIYKIYLTKIMTTTDLGIYNLTLSIYMVFITIVGSSIPLTISKITSTNKALNKQYCTNYSVTSSMILTGAIAIILSIVILLCKPLLTIIIGNTIGYQIILSLLPSIFFTAFYSQLRGYLWGIENYFAVSIIEFVEQILRILFCMGFIMLSIFKSPVIAVGTALSIACGLSTLMGLYLYYKNGGKFQYCKGYYKEIIKSSLPLTLVRLISSLLSPLLAIIVPLQLVSCGLKREIALSELGIVMGMTMPLLSIPSTIIGALCMILIPKISSFTDLNDLSLHKQIKYYLKFTISCSFLFIPIFIALGNPICNYVFSNLHAGVYLQNSAWIMIPLGLTQITTSILNALNQERQTFIYYVISNSLLILGVFILPKYLGIQSMLICIGVSSFIQFLFNIRKIKKMTNIETNILNNIFSHTLISIVIILFTKYFYNILNLIMSQFFAIGFACIFATLFFVLLLFVFNMLNFKTTKEYLLKHKKQQ